MKSYSLALKEIGGRTVNSKEVFEYTVKICKKLGIDKSKLGILKDTINIYIA